MQASRSATRVRHSVIPVTSPPKLRLSVDWLSLFSLTFRGASVRKPPPLPGEGAKPRVGGVGHLDLAHINLATP